VPVLKLKGPLKFQLSWSTDLAGLCGGVKRHDYKLKQVWVSVRDSRAPSHYGGLSFKRAGAVAFELRSQNPPQHVAVTSPVTCAVACLLPLFWQRRPQVVACNLRLGIQSPEAK
jgi:hypothetical protein